MQEQNKKQENQGQPAKRLQKLQRQRRIAQKSNAKIAHQ